MSDDALGATLRDKIRDRLHGNACGCGEWDSHSEEYVASMDSTIDAVLWEPNREIAKLRAAKDQAAENAMDLFERSHTLSSLLRGMARRARNLRRTWQNDTVFYERECDEIESSRFRWAEEAAHLEAEVARLNALVDWYNKSGTLELANHDRAMDERDARIAALTGELAALRASAVVLPEDWRKQLGECQSSGAGVDLVESWRTATVEAAPPKDAIALLWPDMANEGEDWCGCQSNTAGGRSWHPKGDKTCIHDTGVSGTGTEAAPLADVPEAEWREFHEDVTSARGPETQAGSPVVRARLKSRGIGDQS